MLSKVLSFEIGRKILHISCGILIVIFVKSNIITPFDLFLLLLLTIFLSLISRKIKIPLWDFLIRRFEREEWKERFPGRGLVYFMGGAVVSLYLFPRDVAFASIMIATLGDSTSCLLGILYKQLLRKNGRKKYIFGNVGGFFAGLIGASFYVSLGEAGIASAAGLVAEFMEMDLNGARLDDNLIVPLASGTAILVLRKFLTGS